jgi:hypothetical protein
MKWFLGLCVFLFCANLLVMNDVALIRNGAECAALETAWYGEPGAYPPYVLLRWTAGGEWSTFAARLPGAVLTILSLVLFYFAGRRVWGHETALWTVIIAGASFYLANMGKVAAAEPWSLLAQVLGWLFLLRYFKAPAPRWRWACHAALFLAVWIDPRGAFFFFGLSALLLAWRHAEGRRLWRLNPWAALVVSALALQLMGQLDWGRPGLRLMDNWGAWFAAQALGMAPFWGFLLAGLYDTVRKWRKGEELALITLAALLGAALARSPLLSILLALLAAKQMQYYFNSNYPYRGIVRSGAALHLIALCCVAIVLLMRGYATFGAAGYRALIPPAASYWIFSFAAVIGLFGMNRRLIEAGAVFGGLAATLLFWSQLFPLLESRRDWPRRAVMQARAMAGVDEKAVLILTGGGSADDCRLRLYGRKNFARVVQMENGKTIPSANGVFIAPFPLSERWLKSASDTVSIQGRDDRWRPVTLSVFTIVDKSDTTSTTRPE